MRNRVDFHLLIRWYHMISSGLVFWEMFQRFIYSYPSQQMCSKNTLTVKQGKIVGFLKCKGE